MGNQIVFLAEFKSVKNVRYSAVEICCTDILRMELVTGTLNLHLCAPFSMIWLLSWGAMSKDRHGWSTPGSRGGWGYAKPGCGAQLFYRSARTWESHRGCLVLNDFLEGYKKLSQSSVRISTIHCRLWTSPHYYQSILCSHSCIFFSPSMLSFL